ncbi:hypothetical protein CLAIMM_07148 [Cladophialophora immunda]|nr:hypothetical protein CLAIMM_07148 [Cladophialophora immunda]
MLLHSNRFMSWIENRHIPNLTGAGLRIKTYSKPFIDAMLGVESDDEQSNDEAATSLPNDYTDVWCELFQLSRAYWDESRIHQQTIDNAMAVFWDYVTDRHRDKEMRTTTIDVDDRFTTKMKEANEDQCASEFLGWLINLSVEQLRYFINKKVNRRRSRLDQATLDKVVDLVHVNIHELLRVTQTQRARCMQCGSIHNVKTRFSTLDEQTILSLPLPASADGRVPVTLEDCLVKNSKDDFEWRCSTCSNDTANRNADNENGAIWRKIYSPPDVLFVQLQRFRPRRGRNGNVVIDSGGNMTWEKDDTQVTVPEELDLTPFLETRGEPANISAKYRLEAIVNHQGDKDQGHYIGYVRRGDSWYVFNDALKVKKTSFKDILKHKGDFTPYVLLYERVVDDQADGSDEDQATSSSGVGGSQGDANARHTGDGEGSNNHDKSGRNDGSQSRGSQPPANGAQDGRQSSSAQLKVAVNKEARPGRLLIDIKANFGQYEIYLPTFVLENYVPSSDKGNGASIHMDLSDSTGPIAEIAGGGSFGDYTTGETGFPPIISLRPSMEAGRTLCSARGVSVDRDGQRQFKRSDSGDTELDPALLPDVPTHSPLRDLPDAPKHSPCQHRPPAHDGGLGNARQNRKASSPRDVRQSPREDGAPLFYQETIKQGLHSMVLPNYQAEIAALKTQLVEYEDLLEDTAEHDEARTRLWHYREASLLDTHKKQQELIVALEDEVRLLREHCAFQYYNPRGAGIGLGIYGVDTAEQSGQGTTGAGQKRTFGQVDEDVQQVGSDAQAQVRASKRPKISSSSPDVAVGDEDPFTEPIDYDSRDLTELHYDSAGGRLYSEEDGADAGMDMLDEDDSVDDDSDSDSDGDSDSDDADGPPLNPQGQQEESPLPDYEDMVPEDEQYDASTETSPQRWWYGNYDPRMAMASPSPSRRFPSTPTRVMPRPSTPWAPRTPTRPITTSRLSPLQIRHTPGQGRVDGRVRSSPRHYQTGGGSSVGAGPGFRISLDQDGLPFYTES